MNDDLKSTLIKAVAMLVVVLAEYWVMQPYHEPMLAKVWQTMARFCYRIAQYFGELGIHYEYNYFEAMP
jgi:hypothetical protein